MDSIEGFILVGGQSRRMGADKAKLRLAGQSFVERIANELGAVTSSVRLVGGKPDTARINLQTLPDVFPGWGALGGVHAAISACDAEWAMVVACDFPFVTQALFTKLAGVRADFEAVAPIQGDGIAQPLCTLYRVDPCRRVAERFINSGERKPLALLQSVKTRWVPFDEVRGLKGADRFFDNINTPEDYLRASEKGPTAHDVAMGSKED